MEHDKFGCKHSACLCKPDKTPKSIVDLPSVFTDYSIPSPEFDRMFQKTDKQQRPKAIILALSLLVAGIAIFVAGIFYVQFMFELLAIRDVTVGSTFRSTIIELFWPIGAGGFLTAIGVVALKKTYKH